MSISMPDGLLELLRRPSQCFFATVMPDGSPQLTQTWVTTDCESILINVVEGLQKSKNVARDPRVSINIADPDNVFSYYSVRGRVIDATTEGAQESINEISQKYLGCPYPKFRGVPETRLLLTIAVDSVQRAGG
jgi:PPOX class probable F420-dependent enzyme